MFSKLNTKDSKEEFEQQLFNIFLFDNKKYHILLNDGSLICFYYQFDENGKIVKHCLYYIPAPSENIFSAFQTKFYNSITEYYSDAEIQYKIDCLNGGVV